jgi:GNAT superfamily N-acetyltransferase
LLDEPEPIWVAVDSQSEKAEILGRIGIRFHHEDQMGEIYILAVDPTHQRRGVSKGLMDHGMALMREAGLAIVMVETGDDPGHAPSRAAYEQVGFERWPVARYFQKL